MALGIGAKGFLRATKRPNGTRADAQIEPATRHQPQIDLVLFDHLFPKVTFVNLKKNAGLGT